MALSLNHLVGRILRGLSGLLVGLSLFLLPPFFSLVQAKPTIDWFHSEWPPYFFVDGPNKNQGNSDKILRLLMESLPQYEHNLVQMNFGRFWTLLEDGWHVCSSIAFVNDQRKTFTRFSTPIAIILAQRIIVPVKVYKDLGSPRQLSLVELMKNEMLKGGLLKKRSYTAAIDRLLEQHEPSSNIERLSLISANTIPMLIRGRMDYTLDYLGTTAYYEMLEMGEVGNLKSIEIEEIPPLTYNRVACPRTRWGTKVIRDVNAVLKKLKPTEEFRKLVELDAAGDEKGIQTIRDSYDSFLRGRYPPRDNN